jgi:hypothetical protein
MAAFTPTGVEAVVKNLNGFMRDLGKMNDGIGRVGTSATEASGKFGGFSSALSNVATIAGGAVVAAIGAAAAATVGLGVAGVKAAISYESAFAGVLKTTDGLTDSAGNLTAAGEDLRQGFIDLSKEVPISADALANIGELGGQLGIQKENLLDFTETIAQLGVTTNLTTEEAAQEFAQLANIMGTSQDDFDKLGSSLVALGNSSATTEQKILSFASRIAGAGKIAGLTETDILAIGAAMSSVGVEAEAGGTAVQKVLLSMNEAVNSTTSGFVDNTAAIGKTEQKLFDLRTQLQIATLRQSEFTDKTKESTRVANQARIDKLTRQIEEQEVALVNLANSHGELQGAGKELQAFARTAGLSVDKFTELYERDAAGAFKLFVEGLSAAGDDATAILAELGLEDQRLIKSFLSLAGAGDLLSASIDTSTQAWAENTALSKEAEQRFATTESKIQLLKNTFDALKIAIGTPFLDVLQKLVDAFRGFIDENAGKVEAFFTNISEAVAKFIENINTGIDPLTNFQALLSRVLQAFGVDQSDALTFAIKFREAFEAVVQFWESTLRPAFDQIVLFLQENIPIAMDSLSQFWENTLRPALEGIGQTVQEKIIPAIEDIVTSFGRLREWWDTNGPAVRELVDSFVEGIESGFSTISDTIVPFVVEQFDKIVSWWIENGPLMTPIIEGIAKDLSGIGDAVATAWEIAEEPLTNIIDSILSIGETILKVSGEDWDGAWISMEEAVASFGKAVEKLVFGIVEEVTGVENAAEELEKTWTGVHAQLGEILNRSAEKIGDGLNDMSESLGEALDNMLRGIVQFGLDIIDSVQSAADDLASIFTDFDWEEVGAAIMQGIATGVKNNAAALNDTIRALAARAWESAKDQLGISSPSKVFMVAGVAIVDGVIEGINTELPIMLETVTDAMEAVIEEADKVVQETPQKVSLEPFTEMGENLGRALAAGFRSESENTLDAIKDTLGAASGLSGLFVKEFERQTFGPLEERGERLAKNMERFTQGLNEAFGRLSEEDFTAQEAALAAQEKAFADNSAAIEKTGQLLAELQNELQAGTTGLIDNSDAIAGAELKLSDLITKLQIAKLKQSEFTDKTKESTRLANQATIDKLTRQIDEQEMALASLVSSHEQLQDALTQEEVDDLTAQIKEQEAALIALQQARENIETVSEVFGRELTEAELKELISQAQQQKFGLFDFGLTPEQLAAIERVIDIQQAQAQLIKEQEEAEQRLLEIERQRQQLGFLQEQLKLLQLIRDAGLDPAAILGGLELGLDADVSGLLAATSAATQALIDQAEQDLGIGSPSKVFMEIGRNVMAGLTGGIQSALQFPRQAVAQATQMMTPQVSGVTNNTQNVNITANISNGMDLAGFQAAANRALGNGVLI